MHKARKKIAEMMPKIDVVIEIVDARIPVSSGNPMIYQIVKDKPRLKILNKNDLADSNITKKWIKHFNLESNVSSYAVSTNKPNDIKKIPDYCKKLAPNRARPGKPVRVMIMGIPNVGKSTIINILKGKNVAETSNRPAVTRNQQRIIINKFVELYDTPGLLWPKIDDDNQGFRLAVTGAVRDAVVEITMVAKFGLKYVLDNYPEEFNGRFKFDKIPTDENEALELIAKKRGCLLKAGELDLIKASEIFLNELRSGKIGKISLESPEEYN
jgi:ribosome biogenesis GTPase A